MTTAGSKYRLFALNNAPLFLFVFVLAVFGLLSPKFISLGNLSNILIQSSSTAVVATGMTFVLVAAGVDLSVGAIMFVAAAVAGKLALAGCPLWAALFVMPAVGICFGALNALCVTRLRVVPFIVTLGTLYAGRGFALWITQTRAMNLPADFLAIWSGRCVGVPIPILVLALTAGFGHWVLTRTTFGRQVYATGHDEERARKAGVNTRRVLFSVYVISGCCAALGAILSLAQLGAVSPTFGNGKEFTTIAAAVLGGTSLFGGRGNVLPGTLLGAVLIQSIENGLVVLNADPYLYPLVTSAIIFVAVLTDSLRTGLLARLTRRKIRPEDL